MTRSYGQFCGLARALDHVGDRWTLLIVRELLLRDASYGDLQRALGDIATNLLAERLRGLEADGIVTRDAVTGDRRRGSYRLTTLGRGLEPVVRALIVWGAHWMREGPGDDRFDPTWTALALRALVSTPPPDRDGSFEFRFEGGHVRVAADQDRQGTTSARPDDQTPDVIVEGPATLLLALGGGQLGLEEAESRGVRVQGDRELLRALIEP